MNIINEWTSPPSNLTISRNELHIWRARLDTAQSDIDDLEIILSADEKERSERFHFERHKRRYVASRGILRLLLGRYLDIKPDEVLFNYNPQGKPFLINNPSLTFNLSHSHELCVYGITLHSLLGIDLEYTLKERDVEKLAQRFFLPDECNHLSSYPEDKKNEIFLQFWTIKEAYLKATGEGLSGLEQVKVSITTGTLEDSIKDWWIKNFIPFEGYIASVVAKETPKALKFYQLTAIG